MVRNNGYGLFYSFKAKTMKNYIHNYIHNCAAIFISGFLIVSRCFAVEAADEWKVVEEKNKLNNSIITLTTNTFSLKGVQSEAMQQNGDVRIGEIWTINDLTIVISRSQAGKQASISMAGASPNLYFSALSNFSVGKYEGDFIFISQKSSAPLVCLMRSREGRFYSIMSSTEEREAISLYVKRQNTAIDNLLNGKPETGVGP
jgi:hypothetical protein